MKILTTGHYLAWLVVVMIGSMTWAVAEADEFEQKIDRMEMKLVSIEASLNDIEKKSKIDRDGSDIDKALESYVEEVKQVYDLARADMTAFAETKGKRGGFEKSQTLEKSIHQHRDRLEKLIGRMTAIEGGIRSGDIELSESIVSSMSKEERLKFREMLLPEADKKYKQKIPLLFKGDVKHMSDQEWQASRRCDACCAFTSQSKGVTQSPLVGRLADAIVPRAEAGLVVGCAVVCASASPACVGCIMAVPAGVILYDGWRKCLRDCGSCKWYKPWSCVCRAGCTVAFLILIG